MPIWNNNLLIFDKDDIFYILTLPIDINLIFRYQIDPKVKIIQVINNEIIEFDNPIIIQCKRNEKIIINNENNNIFNIMFFKDKESEKENENENELDEKEALNKLNQFKNYADHLFGKEKSNEILNKIITPDNDDSDAAEKCGVFFVKEATKCLELAINAYKNIIKEPYRQKLYYLDEITKLKFLYLALGGENTSILGDNDE